MKKTGKTKKEQYEEHKKSVRVRQAEISTAGREIGISASSTDGDGETGMKDGGLPAVVNPRRKASCKEDFLRFCLTYHPNIFTKKVSKNHPKISAIMEHAALNGGSYAWCDHRGGAKTTFCECWIEWVLLYGHCKFVIYCGASKDAAKDSFDSVKSELESNDLLLEDFPEVCYPIRKLEGKPQKAKGMLLNGEELGMVWKDDKVVLPTVPGSAASGSVFKALGFSGRLRGQKHKTRDGRNIRPDGVIVDDIQKDLTARNPKNVTYQLKVLLNCVKQMREKGHKFTLLVPGTRVGLNCFMSRLTLRKDYPAFQGRIFRAMEKLPDNLDTWQTYWKIWLETAANLQEKDIDDKTAWTKGKAAATAYYRKHRKEMDAGAEVAWPSKYDEDEISGIQNIMNVYLEDEDTFWTEFQNEPRTEAVGGTDITDEILESKILADVPRGIVPAGTKRLTFGCDIQQELIYWLVTAWREGYSGHIVDYGTYPAQPTRDFYADHAPVQLSELMPGVTLEGRLSAAVNAVIEGVLLKDWVTESGTPMKIDRGLMDANWEESRDTVFTVINRRFRSYKKNGRYEGYPLLPARGRGTSRGGYFYETKDHMESKTQFSFLAKPKNDEELCGTVWVNTNKSKSFAAQRLIAPNGAADSVTLFGAPKGWHALLFDHFTSEYATPASIGDMKFEKWMMKPARTENHWWDAYVHCVIANAMEGNRLEVHDKPAQRPHYTFNPEGIG